jgi:kynureninase
MKDKFHLPKGIIYLDGNSLGPLPKSAMARVESMMRDEWGEMLIRGWNEAQWMQQPATLGDRLAPLIGAPAGSVVLGDTLSIKVFQALASALALRPDRKVILSDSGNFPTDLYMADGLTGLLNADHEVRVVAPDKVLDSITNDVAVLMLTQIDYQTGRMHDMNALTRKAHSAGAVAVWDLAHSAGAVPVDMTASQAEFAIGCTYKYINGGPGAPAFIYVRPDLVSTIEPALSGWHGHDSPFSFERQYRPAPGAERMRVGTPPVIQMAALEAALDIWDQVSMKDIRRKSIELSEIFIAEVEQSCPQLRLVSPRDPLMRGSQVSFAFEHGYAVIQALIARGVIGDFRAPDIMRFGFAPLYLDEHEVTEAAAILANILDRGEWDQEHFKKRALVT